MSKSRETMHVRAYEFESDVIKPKQSLRPCPFCLSERVELQRHIATDGGRKTYCVVCPSCAAEGPWDKTSTGAERGWNGFGRNV